MFYPNAGFSLLGHFIGLFEVFFTQVLFFSPKRWVQIAGSFYLFILTLVFFFFNLTAGLSLSLVKLLNNVATESTSFLNPQERAVLSIAGDLVHNIS